MTYAAIDWLSKNLQPRMKLFEWGSGGSTAFFARRVEKVVTVEHDPTWFTHVANTIRQHGYGNASVSLAEPTPPTSSEPLYRSSDERYANLTFSRYVGRIDEYPDDYFDIVVVDGRARPDCIEHAVSKIKPNGYLLLDNAEREEYQRGWDVVRNWPTIRLWGPGPYNTYAWETRICQKIVQTP